MNQDFLRDRNLLLILLFFSYPTDKKVSGLGSMSSIAVSYGENGSVFCGLKSVGGSPSPNCYGSNTALIQSTPNTLSFVGLTAGRGFVCGLLTDSNHVFCWGSTNFIPMGVPLDRTRNAAGYTQISAGDNHLCGLRKPLFGASLFPSVVDCWGYNMTETYFLRAGILSLSAGSGFNCVLFARNMSVSCWGDAGSADLIKLIPASLKFRKISTGGCHICGILEGFNDSVFCCGRSLDPQTDHNDSYNTNSLETSDVFSGQLNFLPPPKVGMVSIVGGKYNACGIRTFDGVVVCWGYTVDTSTPPPPSDVRLTELAAGDYITCGLMLSEKPVCWGVNVPTALQLPVSPFPRPSYYCSPGYYEIINVSVANGLPGAGSHLCFPCSRSCPEEMYQISDCNSTSDRHCRYNCSGCSSNECLFNCASLDDIDKVSEMFWSVQLPIVIVEICFAVLLIIVVLGVMFFYIVYKLRRCKCSKGDGNSSVIAENQSRSSELLIQKAPTFTYTQLEQATNGFHEDSLVGKGSFSCVYKGVLTDGTPIAVKRPVVSNDSIKCSKEFLNELDLLSRLNHAHLLSLLGYCDQGRLLVYEFMSNGSLHKHLHGKDNELKGQLDWVKRVTIAVQASRGIEYLHGYACPPVIHRDIKSSNILIDEEHNARVSDFGLSILGPINGGGPLSELPAGTLGYLDPEYYSFHTLTTKSDVYSFGVLLLEILSGRRAIDMKYEKGNIVEWAVPLIESNNMEEILDPVLEHPSDLEGLRRVCDVAGKCVRMRGKDRPSMDRVTTALEQALAILIGGSWEDGARILPSEVVLGVTRLHKKASQKFTESRKVETGAPSWTSCSSVGSSERIISSFHDVDWKNVETGNDVATGDGSGRVVEEIEPASPREHIFLQHNF